MAYEFHTPVNTGVPTYTNDCTIFSDILTGVQNAWGKSDLNTLRRYMTPEMLSYFSDALSNNTSQGVENRIENITLVTQEIQEAWTEWEIKYATILLSWTAHDYMVRMDTGAIVDGDPNTSVKSTETWTFMKNIDGGNWILSAIQQMEA